MKNTLEVGPGISPGELFQNGVWDCLLAVEHAIKKNDNELLEYINTLIEKLKNEQGDEENIPLAKFLPSFSQKQKMYAKRDFISLELSLHLNSSAFWKNSKKR